MENSKNKFQNTFNLGNNNQNNNLNPSQNNFNINNNISDFQQSNNNEFINLNNNNYYYNANNSAPLPSNQMYNNINNEEINNNFRNNNSSTMQNNYYQNNSQKESKDKKNYSKNFPKRKNYMPKNLILNQNQNNNIPYPNYPISYQNIYPNNQNMSQFPNFASFNENKHNFNYIQNNEIDANFRNIISEIKNDENEIINNVTSNKVFNSCSYIFNANIEDVAEILTDENFFKNNCPSEIIDNINFPKNCFSENGNSIISCRWKKFYTLKLECTNQKWSKNSISFSLKVIESNPGNIGSLEMNFKYYYNTCQNNTLFIIEYILDKGILSEVFKEEFLDFDLNEICSCCEQMIKQRKKEKSHVTSIIINTSKDKAWKCITNINKKRYINYMNKYNLYYLLKDEICLNDKNNKILQKLQKEKDAKEYHMEKGDAIFILKNENENKIFSKLFIQEIKEDNDKNEIIFSCDKSEESKSENENKKENLKVLNQKIILSIQEITKEICYFEFKHLWQDWVDVNKVNSLDLLKVNSLKILKQILTNDENANKKNNKDNSLLIIFNLLCPTEI